MATKVKTSCYVKDTLPGWLNPQVKTPFSERAYLNMLTVADRVQCVNRIVWNNLPSAFTTLDVETMLYEMGAICCYIDGPDDTLVFSPFTLKGAISVKGKLHKIQPITLDGKAHGDKRRVYTLDGNIDFDSDCCIIIKDYTGCITSDNVIPRSIINRQSTICDEVKVYRQLLLNIIMSIKKLIVNGVSEEQKDTMLRAAEALLDPERPVVGFRGGVLSDKYNVTQFVDKIDVDSFTRAISFYNKIRRNFNGVPAPDTFEKKERLITPELENIGKGSNLVLTDALLNRQIACDTINSARNLNIDVRINESLNDNYGGGNDGSVHEDLEI